MSKCWRIHRVLNNNIDHIKDPWTRDDHHIIYRFIINLFYFRSLIIKLDLQCLDVVEDNINSCDIKAKQVQLFSIYLVGRINYIHFHLKPCDQADLITRVKKNLLDIFLYTFRIKVTFQKKSDQIFKWNFYIFGNFTFWISFLLLLLVQPSYPPLLIQEGSGNVIHGWIHHPDVRGPCHHFLCASVLILYSNRIFNVPFSIVWTKGTYLTQETFKEYDYCPKHHTKPHKFVSHNFSKIPDAPSIVLL